MEAQYDHGLNMNQDDSLLLYARGKDAWNAWAAERLALRAELEASSRWNATDQDTGRLEGLNKEAKLWLADSHVDFSNHTFDSAEFADFEFPAGVRFYGAHFNGSTHFSGAIFKGYANFSRSSFAASTIFRVAEFRGGVEFVQAKFGGPTYFDGTIFNNEAGFVAIVVEGYFTIRRATFDSVPDFAQARFTEAPALGESNFRAATKAAQSWRNRFQVYLLIPERWRTLRRLAVQGHDHEREQQFFAEEIKSLRFVSDWPFPSTDSEVVTLGGVPGKANVGRFWIGLCYQYFSNFGRSILLPFVIWCAVTLISSVYYFQHHLTLIKPSFTMWEWVVGVGNRPAFAKRPCHTDSNDALAAARYVAIHNGLVFSGIGRSIKLEQSYVCLYGSNRKSEAVIPDNVVYFGILQSILSAAMIFLSLLAVRNNFRIK